VDSAGSGRSRAAPRRPGRRWSERLVLTLPLDPRLCCLARLVALHFLRHNGIASVAARRGARRVQERCQAWIRGVPKRGGNRPLAIVLTSRPGTLEIEGAIGARGARRSLLRCPRPTPP
jgi:hypothetical protein